MRWLFVVMALGIQAAPAGAQTPSSSSVATTVWNELEAVRWSGSYADWQRAHPQSACEPFVAPADEVIDNGIGAVEWWSYRCRRTEPSNRVEWFFYAFTPEAPVARLEQLRFVVDDNRLSADQLAGVHGDLSNRLSGRYGAGERPNAGDVHEFGSAFWRDVVHWKKPDVEIYLYFDGFPSGAPHLKLQARHRPLLDTMAMVRRLQDDGNQQWEDSATPLDTQLAKELAAEFPSSAALLSSPAQPEREQTALFSALIELLGRAPDRTNAVPPF